LVNIIKLHRISKMQKLTVVLFFGLVALASASSKFKRLTPVNPVPQCSLTEVAACADEISGELNFFLFFFFAPWAYYTVFSGAGVVSGTLHPAVWDTHISS
jgi:hypothetical protein